MTKAPWLIQTTHRMSTQQNCSHTKQWFKWLRDGERDNNFTKMRSASTISTDTVTMYTDSMPYADMTIMLNTLASWSSMKIQIVIEPKQDRSNKKKTQRTRQYESFLLSARELIDSRDCNVLRKLFGSASSSISWNSLAASKYFIEKNHWAPNWPR